jgi:Flp pilus assembly secretin CpaC
LSLVIRQTQKVHDEIKDLLEQLRRLQDLQVTIEVRFITVADRFFERIGIDFDFNVQDTVGDDPTAQPFGSVMPFVQQQGQQGQIGQQGQQNQAGGIMGRAFADGVVSPFAIGLGGSNPAIGMGGIGGQGQQQQGQQQQGQQQQGQQQQGVVGITGFFDPPPLRNLPALDNYPKGGTIIGLTAPGMFTPDLDIAFRQGSFDIGVPDFGGFNPDAGIQVGLAILSDIEAFFFIQAAQGDERSNLMFAPKVTLFNGQTAFVTDSVQRPFVTSLTPTVGFFSVGFTPQITVLQEGVSLTVTAVISADRRFVRLTVVPSFTNITDVFTFSFVSGGQGAQQGVQGLGGQQGQGGQQGFQGGQQGGQQQGVGGIGGLVGGQQGGQVGQQGQQQGQVGQQGQQNQQAAQNITVQQPVFEIVTVTTTVSVPDGGTVLLGGVKRLREGRNMAGVPILNKIPYISRLFKNTGVGRETESLMLMVTPRIIIQEEEEELLGIEID